MEEGIGICEKTGPEIKMTKKSKGKGLLEVKEKDFFGEGKNRRAVPSCIGVKAAVPAEKNCSRLERYV